VKQGQSGIPENMNDKDLVKDKEITEKYTDEDKDIAGNVQTNSPNRNTDKPDATNAGGYKN
jgi:hypothetical protein